MMKTISKSTDVKSLKPEDVRPGMFTLNGMVTEAPVKVQEGHFLMHLGCTEFVAEGGEVQVYVALSDDFTEAVLEAAKESGMMRGRSSVR